MASNEEAQEATTLKDNEAPPAAAPPAAPEPPAAGDAQWPVKSRGCTDIYCVGVYAFGWVVFVIVTLAGLQDGNPTKLYAPRDYSGSYCNVNDNWQTGYDLEGFPALGFTMNVTSTTDLIVKELICSNAARDALMALLPTVEEQQAYLCTCCLTACSRCTGSYKVEKLDSSNLQATISGKMSEFQGSSSRLMDPAGLNGDYFTEIWSEASKHFNMVCLPDCNVNYDSLGTNYRNWTYSMAADDPFQPYWSLLNTSGPAAIKDTIATSFTFKALPTSICNYPESKCVPMPGVTLTEIMPGYCSLGVSEAVDAVMQDALNSLSAEAFQAEFESLTSFGTLFGEALKTADTFACVAVTCIVVALLYMVLLRFFVGYCVWLSLLAVLLVFMLGGGLLMARSSQCQGADLFDTGMQLAVATSSYVATQATNAVNQAVDPNSFEVLSETISGDGGNGGYTGAQTRTIGGYSCLKWGTNGTDAQNYTEENFPNSNLTDNYCRNPYSENASADTRAATIWCFTSDAQVTWQECQPIGVIRPACRNGFAIPDETVRQILEVCAYIVWVIGVFYLILVLCFCSRIREAIAINKVAAMFLMGNPTVLVVPMVQGFIAVLWVGLWLFFATFLLSQVPETYTPSGTFATYAEAYGTDTTPGQCTDKWPTGFPYKDDDNCALVNGTAQCWRCAQPRYAFDIRFAASFFMLLWNNAFNIACGQFIVAAAASAWFFTPKQEKGRKGTTRTAVWWLVRYHLGSLALGSFIIAVVAFIRYVLLYLQKQAEAQKNRVVVMILRVMRCCLWCLEQFLKFINKNAYIQIAINGSNFCTAAKNAFYLILNNALRFGAVALLGSVINLMGHVFIIAATVSLGYLYLLAMHPDALPVFPIMSYVVCGYVVARLTMNVFGLSVSTFLQCFLVVEKEQIEGHHFIPDQMLGILKMETPKEEDTPKDKE